ncbi:MAG: TetR/AcrR family transcriptional regulator [Hyphomonadaceae bacterium]|nr:TetR/AcrR family transcriptional regulator [Hyphomonadaceae bacterium]
MKQKRAAPRAKTKGDITRERIRAAVIRLVSRHGVNAVTLLAICEEADITHGGFYFHFASKEEAMIDVASEWIASFKTKVLETPEFDDFYAEIHHMILTYIRGYIANIEVTKLVYALDPAYPEVRAAFSRYQRKWWARLEAMFAAARKARGLPTGMELWIAHAMTSALEGVCVDAFLARQQELTAHNPTPEGAAECMAVIWHRAVTGADPDPRKLPLTRGEAVG